MRYFSLKVEIIDGYIEIFKPKVELISRYIEIFKPTSRDIKSIYRDNKSRNHCFMWSS